MVGYSVAVAATMARTRVPELIAEAFAAEAVRSKAAKDVGADTPVDPGADTAVGDAAADARLAAQPEPLESAP
jgi:hypothetical protein